MMDDNSSDTNIVVDDWLAELKSDFQLQVGKTRIEDIGFQFSSSNPNNISQLGNCYVKLEEKQCQEDAASRSDSMSRTCQTIMPSESLYYHGCSAASSSSALIQTDAAAIDSNLQKLSAYSHEPVGNPVGQSMQSSIFTNTHREFPNNQLLQQIVPQCQHQQLQQNLLKQKVQQPCNQPSLMKSNIQCSYPEQEEKNVLSLPTDLQSSQQPILTAVQDQQRTGRHPNATILQKNHELGLLEKQLLTDYQQQRLTTFNQSRGLQNNFSGLQQQQKQLIGACSDMLKMQPHHHELDILQQPHIAASQQNVQQMLQPMHLHQLPGLQKQSNSLQESMKKRHQTSAALLPQNFTVDRQKQLKQSQRAVPEASSASFDSTCRTECARLADWRDQAYQELESTREMHLLKVIKLHKRARELCLQPSSAELAIKNEKARIFIEKTMKFLQMPRSDIIHWSKDKFYHSLKSITRYLNSVRQYGQQLQPPGSQSQVPQLQQQINMKPQFDPLNPIMTSVPAGSQANKINLVHNGSLTGSRPRDASIILQHGSIHQYTVSRPQQTNVINLPCNGALNGMEQRNAPDYLQHGGVRSLHPNKLSTPLPTNSSHMSPVNALDPTMNLITSSSTIPFLNLKQQPKHQTMHTQISKQLPQQPLIEQNKQQMLMQKINEANELKVGQIIGFGSRMLKEQHRSVVQHMEYSPQCLLPCTHLNSSSPQISQHSSPHNDQKNLLSPLSKAGTPLQSAASPFIVPSPSTPLTPSSLQLDPKKQASNICPLLVTENIEHPQAPVSAVQIQSQATIENQSLVTGTPEILASPMLAEFNVLEDIQSTNTKEPSLKCLLQVVESISPGALSSSVWDIGLVIDTIDRVAETTTSRESRYTIFDDLEADTNHCLQGRSFSLHRGSTSSERMKRYISSTASDLLLAPGIENNGLQRLSCQTPNMESTAISRVKRPRIELNAALLEEIKEINQELVETVIDVVLDSTEEAARSGFGEGTIVRCSYSAIGCRGNFKHLYASSRVQLPILRVRLLVPADYPNYSPILLNASSIDWSEAGESENLSKKAKSSFIVSLRKLLQPMSLGEIARTWDVCARTVLFEFAQSIGGGSFSSTYGTWEHCITAA